MHLSPLADLDSIPIDLDFLHLPSTWQWELYNFDLGRLTETDLLTLDWPPPAVSHLQQGSHPTPPPPLRQPHQPAFISTADGNHLSHLGVFDFSTDDDDDVKTTTLVGGDGGGGWLGSNLEPTATVG